MAGARSLTSLMPDSAVTPSQRPAVDGVPPASRLNFCASIRARRLVNSLL